MSKTERTYFATSQAAVEAMTSSHQRLRYKDGLGFYGKGYGDLRGRIVAWTSGMSGKGNLNAKRAVQNEYKKGNQDKTMPFNERYALIGGKRNGAITRKNYRFMEAVRGGKKTDIQEKFDAIGARVPHKVHYHDQRHKFATPYVVGSGNFNNVYGDNYYSRKAAAQNDGKKTLVEWIVKPLTAAFSDPFFDAIGGAPHKGKFPAVAGLAGIPRDNPRWGDRNVACSKLDEQIGLNVFARAEFGVSGGEPVLAMERAIGEPAKKAIKNNPDLVWNPNVQKAYSDFEVGVFLTGSADCHAENYFLAIDKETGAAKLTGIDNDQAFGKFMLDPDGPRWLGKDTPCHHVGFPSAISAEAYDALMALKDADNLLGVIRSLQPHLGPDEINAFINRIDVAIERAEALEQKGRVIADWESWKTPDGNSAAGGDYWTAIKTGPTFIDRDGNTVPRSLLLRDITKYNPAAMPT